MSSSNARKGGIISLIIVLVGIFGIGMALTLYWLEDFSFFPWKNYISDLSVGLNGSNIVFIVMIVLMAVSSVPFFIYLGKYLKEKNPNSGLINFGIITGVLGAIAMIIMVFFPMDQTQPDIYSMHIIIGIPVFVFIGCYSFVFGIFSYKDSRIPNNFAIINFSCCICSFLFAVFIGITELTQLLSRNMFTYLIGWATFTLLLVWLLLISMKLLKNSK
ncbi:MAG: DUF998 domain-containing protein [Promethearchaeota archaeon]